MTIEILTIENEVTPVDLALFRRFKREVPGLVEKTLAMNPGLAALGPFPPIGTTFKVEVPAPAARREPRKIIRLTD
jgi:phage tail protein X